MVKEGHCKYYAQVISYEENNKVFTNCFQNLAASKRYIVTIIQTLYEI